MTSIIACNDAESKYTLAKSQNWTAIFSEKRKCLLLWLAQPFQWILSILIKKQRTFGQIAQKSVLRTAKMMLLQQNFKNEQTYKPGSVVDSHLSWSVVANSIMRLLRGEASHFLIPLSSCFRRGLQSLLCYHKSGGLLPHLSTLTCKKTGGLFLLHFP